MRVQENDARVQHSASEGAKNGSLECTTLPPNLENIEKNSVTARASSSKFSTEAPERRYGRKVAPTTFFESKDNFRRAKAVFDASVAADEDGEVGGEEAVRLPASVRRR
jgi:hypothetical protein